MELWQVFRLELVVDGGLAKSVSTRLELVVDGGLAKSVSTILDESCLLIDLLLSGEEKKLRSEDSDEEELESMGGSGSKNDGN